MSKFIINWIEPCNKCKSNEIEICGSGVTDKWVTQGASAECKECGNKGHVEIYGDEECCIAWDEE